MNKVFEKIIFFLFKSKDQKHIEKTFNSYRPYVEYPEGRVLIDFTHAAYPKWNVKNFFIAKINERKNLICDAFYPSKYEVWFNKKVWFLSFLQFFYNKEKGLIKSIVSGSIIRLPVLSFFERFNIMRESYLLWRDLEKKKDLLELHVDGIVFGDLIYDTYLKWFKKPTLDMKSIKLLYVIFSFLLYKLKIEKLLVSKKYDNVYLTHSVYISFGVLARVAVNRGIRVFVIQNTRGQFFKELKKGDYFQTPDFSNYKKKLDSIEDTELSRLRNIAKDSLEDRFNGVIDQSISYMRASPYSNNSESGLDFLKLDMQSDKPRVLILLHCFFDSPHIYKSMLFEDFFEWINFLLHYFEEKKINIYVKPHPNGIDGNDKIIEFLKLRYRQVIFLDKNVSNNDLMNPAIFPFALTVYGTMAHEFAYKGVTVINAGDNPHADFDFTITPKDKVEYKKALDRVFNQDVISPNEDEILDFYVSHNLLGDYYSLRNWYDLIENKFGMRSSYADLNQSLSNGNIEVILKEIDGISCFRGIDVE